MDTSISTLREGRIQIKQITFAKSFVSFKVKENMLVSTLCYAGGGVVLEHYRDFLQVSNPVACSSCWHELRIPNSFFLTT